MERVLRNRRIQIRQLEEGAAGPDTQDVPGTSNINASLRPNGTPDNCPFQDRVPRGGTTQRQLGPTISRSQPAIRVSQIFSGTTKAGLPQRRLKWTQELNELVLRTYFRVTRCEGVKVQ